MNTTIPMTAKARDLTRSRKKQFRFSDGHDTVNVDSYWDGGSKSCFAVFNIDTGMEVLPQGNAPFGARGRLGYKLITGDIVIETGTFCGKPATPATSQLELDQRKLAEYAAEIAALREAKARLEAMMPLFEEARDALPAISLASAKLRGIRLDLAARMDEVGDPVKWAARAALGGAK